MTLVERLRAIVGPAQLLTAADDTAPYLTDWRQRYRGAALAVVRPADTGQVAAVVRACAATRTPMVPQGGNTGLVGGGTPDASGQAVVISLLRLNRIRAIDPIDDVLGAEAGCTLQAVQEAARAHGRLFPLSLAAEGSATIGGNLATNAGGTQVLRYGTMRELTLGLEVVLPNGEVWNGLRTLRKDNTGYDLRSLFIGAEGTLGIVTAATLRLFALPTATQTAFVALPTLDAALALLARCRTGAGAALTAFEVMSDPCLRRLAHELPQVRLPLPLDAEASPWYALIELAGARSLPDLSALLETLLSAALAAGEALDAVIAQSQTESQSLWNVRESIPEAHAKAGGNVKHDISVPISAIARFVAETDAALQARYPWIAPAVFGHLGDGNLHYNMGTRAGTPIEVAFAHETQINRIVHDAVAACGGSISAEHGVGQLKREAMREYKSAVELDLMRALKATIDPLGLMNPGKVL